MKKKYKYTFNHYFIERNFNKNLNENFSVNIFNASSNIKEGYPRWYIEFSIRTKKKKNFVKRGEKKKKRIQTNWTCMRDKNRNISKNLLYFSRKKLWRAVYVIRRIIYIGNPLWRVRPRHPPHYRKSTMTHTFTSPVVL